VAARPVGPQYAGGDLLIQHNDALCQSLVDAFAAGAPIEGDVDVCCNDESC
jgi:hypothetical protein